MGGLAYTLVSRICNSATPGLWFSNLSALNTRSRGGYSSCRAHPEMQGALPRGILEQMCMSRGCHVSLGASNWTQGGARKNHKPPCPASLFPMAQRSCYYLKSFHLPGQGAGFKDISAILRASQSHLLKLAWQKD